MSNFVLTEWLQIWFKVAKFGSLYCAYWTGELVLVNFIGEATFVTLLFSSEWESEWKRIYSARYEFEEQFITFSLGPQSQERWWDILTELLPCTISILNVSFFHFKVYLGQATVRGILCDHWQSCRYWPDLASNFTLDSYFTGYPNSQPQPNLHLLLTITRKSPKHFLLYHLFAPHT